MGLEGGLECGVPNILPPIQCLPVRPTIHLAPFPRILYYALSWGAGSSEPPTFVCILVTCASSGLVVDLVACDFLTLAFLLNCSTMASQSDAVLGLTKL